MLLLFLLAGLLTLLLVLVIIGAILAGLLIWLLPRTRLLVPFVMLPLVLGASGALAGSWGLAVWAERVAGMSVLPLWAWLVGLLSGGVLGTVLGFLGAFFMSRAMWARSTRVMSASSVSQHQVL